MEHRADRRRMLGSLAAAVLAAGSLFSGQAWAAVRGRFRLNRKIVDEEAGSWRVLVMVRLAAPAPSATLTFQLDWRQHVDFQGEGDGQRRRVLPQPRLVSEQQDAQFADPKGKVGSEARMDVLLSREREFRAGEWSLELRGPDGPIGGRAKVTLRGSNPAG